MKIELNPPYRRADATPTPSATFYARRDASRTLTDIDQYGASSFAYEMEVEDGFGNARNVDVIVLIEPDTSNPAEDEEFYYEVEVVHAGSTVDVEKGVKPTVQEILEYVYTVYR